MKIRLIIFLCLIISLVTIKAMEMPLEPIFDLEEWQQVTNNKDSKSVIFAQDIDATKTFDLSTETNSGLYGFGEMLSEDDFFNDHEVNQNNEKEKVVEANNSKKRTLTESEELGQNDSQKKYKCVYVAGCTKSYFRGPDLNRHIDEYHKNKKHACLQCDKEYTAARSLNDHVKKDHSTDTKSTLSKKVKIRTNPQHSEQIKKYSCNGCGKEYSNSRDLKNHKDSAHENIRYSCNICSHDTVLKRNLVNHIVKKHTENNRCSTCWMDLDNLKKLKRHLESEHIKRVENS